MELSLIGAPIHSESSAVRDLETESDNELLRLSARGDESAFAAVYRRHQGPIFRFALHMSGHREIAEEVTQEVFLTLIREPKQYRIERGPLQAFLIGVARNKIRRLCARQKSSDFRLDDADRANTVFAASVDPFERCSKEHEVRALQTAILTLPPRYREVIVLCDLEEVPYAEAARLLDCVVGTIRSRLYRARGILGAKLRKHERCSV